MKPTFNNDSLSLLDLAQKLFALGYSLSEIIEFIQSFTALVNAQAARITQLEQKVEQLNQQDEQLNNQLGYCFAYLNRLGMSTDADSLDTYHEYSCGNHYNC